MKKINLTILADVQYCLRNTLLPVLETGLDYQIIKNLSKIDKCLRDKEAEISLLDEKYYFRKEDGKPIMYAFEVTGKVGKYVLDENSKFVIVEEEKTQPCRPRVDSNNPDYIKAIGEASADFEFEFFEFPKDKVKELFDSGKFSGLDLSPLFGYIIVD